MLTAFVNYFSGVIMYKCKCIFICVVVYLLFFSTHWLYSLLVLLSVVCRGRRCCYWSELTVCECKLQSFIAVQPDTGGGGSHRYI